MWIKNVSDIVSVINLPDKVVALMPGQSEPIIDLFHLDRIKEIINNFHGNVILVDSLNKDEIEKDLTPTPLEIFISSDNIITDNITINNKKPLEKSEEKQDGKHEEETGTETTTKTATTGEDDSETTTEITTEKEKINKNAVTLIFNSEKIEKTKKREHL